MGPPRSSLICSDVHVNEVAPDRRDCLVDILTHIVPPSVMSCYVRRQTGSLRDRGRLWLIYWSCGRMTRLGIYVPVLVFPRSIAIGIGYERFSVVLALLLALAASRHFFNIYGQILGL